MLDAVLLDTGTLLGPSALIEIQQVAYTDTLIGFASPRLKAAPFGHAASAKRFESTTPDVDDAAQALVQQLLPRTSYVPITDDFCLFVKWTILAEFGLYDETIISNRDANIDLMMRCNRRGYRTVLANHAFVRSGSRSTSCSRLGHPSVSLEAEPTSSTTRLLQKYPEYIRATRRYCSSISFRLEYLISGLIPSPTGKRRLLFECSNLSSVRNGTSELAIAIMTTFARQFSHEYDCYVSGNYSAFKFLGIHWQPYLHYVGDLRDARAEGPFAVAIRLIQPFGLADIVNVGLLAPLTGFLILDTIAWDCQYLDADLTTVYDQMLRVTSVLGYISAFSCGQFRKRFIIPARVTEVVALLSLDPNEYVLEDHGEQTEDYILLVGNPFVHKHIRDTVRLYMAEPVKPTLVVLGIKLPDEPGLTSYESGALDNEMVNRLYGGAQVVLYPSNCEGFGFPIMNALGHRRPVIARRLPVFEEIKLGTQGGENVYLFNTTTEMVRFALTKPVWIGDEGESGPIHRWRDTCQAINSAFMAARDRLSFEALYEQQLTVRACQDMIQQTGARRLRLVLESHAWKIAALLPGLGLLGRRSYSTGYRALVGISKLFGKKS